MHHFTLIRVCFTVHAEHIAIFLSFSLSQQTYGMYSYWVLCGSAGLGYLDGVGDTLGRGTGVYFTRCAGKPDQFVGEPVSYNYFTPHPSPWSKWYTFFPLSWLQNYSMKSSYSSLTQCYEPLSNHCTVTHLYHVNLLGVALCGKHG